MYVYSHSDYTETRPFRRSLTQLTHQEQLLITDHFLGFCPRSLGFKLLCWPLLPNGEMLLPGILTPPSCRPLVHDDIFEALSLVAKGPKCRSVLHSRLVACRRENRGWLNECCSKAWVKSLWIYDLKCTNGQLPTVRQCMELAIPP